MAPQKVDEWVDVDEWEDVPAPKKKEPSKGLFDYIPSISDVYNSVFTAPKTISEAAQKFAESVTDPRVVQTASRYIPKGLGFPGVSSEETAAMGAGFLGGAAEGVASQLSPGNLAFAALGGGEVVALNQARRLAAAGYAAKSRKAINLARKLETPTRVASIPIGLEGGRAIVDPESTVAERLLGIPQVAGALLGVRSRVRPAARAIQETPINLAREGDIVLGKEGDVFTREGVDPNYTGGIGDTELAGSVPYRPRPDILSEQIIRPEEVNLQEIPPPVDFNTADEAIDFFSNVERTKNRGTSLDIPDNEVARALEEERVRAEQAALKGGVGKVTVKKNVPETIQRLMKEGYQITGQTEEGFPIMERNLTGPTSIEPQFQKARNENTDRYGNVIPDKSVKTMRDIVLEYLQKDLEAGKINQEEYQSEVNRIQEMTERDVEESRQDLIDIFEGQPQLIDEVERIYREQDPEIIASNAEEYRAKVERMADTAYNPRDPNDLSKFDQEYSDMSDLAQFAQLKAIRTTKRMLEPGDFEPQYQKDIPVDEEGKPVEVREWTPEELDIRKKEIRRDWAIARAKARELGIDDRKYRHLKDLQAAINLNLEPSAQKVATGKKFQVGVNVVRSAQELTTGYSGSLAGIMVREGMQNALDAVRTLGKEGSIEISINEGGVTIQDNGPGMNLDAIMTVFRLLHESGKITQAGATGGKGVGKASYMLGGRKFKLESTVEENGQKVMYSLEGTPDELMQPDKIDIFSEIVDEDAPTGVKFTTDFAEGQEGYSARGMFRDIMKYSKGIETKIKDVSYGAAIREEVKGDRGTSIYYDTLSNNEVEISIPEDAVIGTRSSMRFVFLNNGMYQFASYTYLDEEVNGLPSHIIIDIHPLMEEGAPDYPFPVQRESIKEGLRKEIDEVVKDVLVNPTASRRKMDLQKLWESMPPINIEGSMLPIVLLDPGNRLTPREVNIVTQSPFIRDLMREMDSMMMNILFSIGERGREVVRLGLSFDENAHGMHIPNPFDKGASSAIVINPFIALSRLDAERTALSLVVTALHESAHAYKPNADVTYRPMHDEDLNDPKVGKYVATFMKEINEQGGLDMGHGIAFIKQLGDVYNAFGTVQAVKAADGLERVIRQYSGEIPKVLQIYTNSRGREAVAEDILTGTGIKQADGGIRGENLPGDSERVTPRTASRRVGKLEVKIDKYPKDKQRRIREELVSKGYFATGVSSPEGNPIWEQAEDIPGPIELSKRILRGEMTWRQGLRLSAGELWHLSKGLRAVDPPFVTSAMFRQARPMIGLNLSGWLKAWKSQAAAYGDKVTYNEIIEQISKDELFRRRLGPGGETLPSWAEEWGLQMPVLGKTTGREEMIQSNWAEMIPLWGAHVRASNRAFTAALATTRASALKNFVESAKNQNRNPEEDIELGKEIANAINVLNGKGKLRLELPGSKKGLDIEGAATVLNNLLFSPRYQASIIQMLNPAVYMNADPIARKMYLKGLFSILISWWTLAALAEAMGASVNKDPNNADFGKIRIGNWRLDLGNGIAQYLVLFSRMRPEWLALPFEVPTPPFGEMVQDPGGGKFSSSGTGSTVALGETNAPNRGDLLFGARGFVPNKYHPTARLAWDILFTNRSRPVFLGDRIIQLAMPLMLDDLVEIANEDPMLLPFAFTASGIGLGSQFYEGGAAEKPIYTQAVENLTGIPLTDFDVQLGGR